MIIAYLENRFGFRMNKILRCNVPIKLMLLCLKIRNGMSLFCKKRRRSYLYLHTYMLILDKTGKIYMFFLQICIFKLNNKHE